MRQSDLVAVVALKQEGEQRNGAGCPITYNGVVVTSVKNSVANEVITFLSPTVLSTEQPHLVFLQYADPTDHYSGEFDYFGPCSFRGDAYVIAKIRDVPYGDPAAFEQRYLTAEELGAESGSSELYFVGPESAIGLFVDDVRLLGAKARDKRGRTRLIIQGSLDWRILRESLGPRVWKRSIAINSEDLLDLLQDTDTRSSR